MASVPAASRRHCGRARPHAIPASELTLEEGALLAGLTKGPNYYSPDRYPGRAQERLAYVLGRLQEDGVIGPDGKVRNNDMPGK